MVSVKCIPTMMWHVIFKTNFYLDFTSFEITEVGLFCGFECLCFKEIFRVLRVRVDLVQSSTNEFCYFQSSWKKIEIIFIFHFRFMWLLKKYHHNDVINCTQNVFQQSYVRIKNKNVFK